MKITTYDIQTTQRRTSMEKLGALWLRESKKGTKYMAGVVEIDGQKTDVLIFKNNYKEEDKHPDYLIYLKEEEQQKKSVLVEVSKKNPESEVPF